MPFLELDRLIEQGRRAPAPSLFRPCNRGNLVSEPGTFERLLSTCLTVWVRASPEEHMQRVIAQGDMRPTANNRDAMSDLKRILAEREVLYGKADIQTDTAGSLSKKSVETLIQALRDTPVRDRWLRRSFLIERHFGGPASLSC
jgi:hypothetical protein